MERIKIDALLLHTKLDYIEFGEKPSSFFYKVLKIRQKNSGIDEVYDTISNEEKPQKTPKPTQILKNVHKFYSDLYDSHSEEICEEAQATLLNSLDKKLSPASIRKLEADLTLEELEASVKRMKKGKSPGIDGLPCEFYLKFPRLLPLLLECANHSHSLIKMTTTQRKALLALLHKNGDRANLANWRPISLLCVDYKIITSALAERMHHILSEIIHPSQTCGIINRYIHTNLNLVRDIIDHATENQNTTILFSLDQEKAFDRVSHSYLLQVLQKFGFGPKFCNWIKQFIQITPPTF